MGKSTDSIHIFYILTPEKPGLNNTIRVENVVRAESLAPEIKHFSALYYRPWHIVQRLFNILQIPTKHMVEPLLGRTRNRQGKYARWASLLLAVSYAIQFRLPHILILEDDTTWPVGIT
jgi:hypothetical protein